MSSLSIPVPPPLPPYSTFTAHSFTLLFIILPATTLIILHPTVQRQCELDSRIFEEYGFSLVHRSATMYYSSLLLSSTRWVGSAFDSSVLSRQKFVHLSVNSKICQNWHNLWWTWTPDKSHIFILFKHSHCHNMYAKYN